MLITLDNYKNKLGKNFQNDHWKYISKNEKLSEEFMIF